MFILFRFSFGFSILFFFIWLESEVSKVSKHFEAFGEFRVSLFRRGGGTSLALGDLWVGGSSGLSVLSNFFFFLEEDC